MLRSRFLWKLYAGYAVLILLAALAIGIPVSGRIEEDYLEGLRRVLLAKARLLREVSGPVLEGRPDDSFQQNIRRMGEETETRLTVIRADGTVLADSHEDPGRMDNHGLRPEVVQAREEGTGTSSRFSRTLGKKMMYLALAVSRNGKHAGVVRASLPLKGVRDRTAGIHAILLLGALIALLIGLPLGLLFAHRVTRPLLSMTNAAQAIGSGQYEARVPVETDDEIGNLSRTFNTMADELQNRLQLITTDRNKLQTVLSGMIEGVVAVDREERVMHMNAVAGSILRTDPAGSIGRPVWEITRVVEVPQALSDAIRERREHNREVRLPAERRDRVLQLHCAPIRDAEGKPTGAVLVLHDVTELRHLEDVRRDFVANVSHEVKTPLTAIRGLIETLIEDPSMEPETRMRFQEKIRKHCERLSALVTDLLSLSRVEGEEEALEKRPVDLRDPAQESFRIQAPDGEAGGLTMQIRLPEAPLPVVGDAEALRQAIDNLLNNAVRYTPSGGRVQLRIRAEDRTAVVEVEDTGIGIEPRHQERVFERFYRVDKARSRELGGTGLGLSIVKHIAIAHGGTVSLESTPGSGSTFRIHLPLSKTETPL